jgi:PAS domain S-box-containing protein
MPMSPQEFGSSKKGSDLLLCLLEHSFDAVALVDANGTIQFISPAIRDVLGYEPNEFVGRNGL